MPRGSKEAYTGKQQRKAEHIEESYEERGVGVDEAKRRAWATVNKQDGGGRASAAGRGPSTKSSPRKSKSGTTTRRARSARKRASASRARATTTITR